MHGNMSETICMYDLSYMICTCRYWLKAVNCSMLILCFTVEHKQTIICSYIHDSHISRGDRAVLFFDKDLIEDSKVIEIRDIIYKTTTKRNMFDSEVSCNIRLQKSQWLTNSKKDTWQSSEVAKCLSGEKLL